MLGLSKWFHEQIRGREVHGNQLDFNYKSYSRAAVKLFTDGLHLLQPGPTDIPVIVECVEFLQFEGKPKSSVYERMMIERLLTSLLKAELPLASELLICLCLSKADDFEDNLFLRSITEKLTEESIGTLLLKFDATDELIASLIEICNSKQLLDGCGMDACLYSLLKYVKKLFEDRAQRDFIPNPKKIRFDQILCF